jgi:hypothetical protein
MEELRKDGQERRRAAAIEAGDRPVMHRLRGEEAQEGNEQPDTNEQRDDRPADRRHMKLAVERAVGFIMMLRLLAVRDQVRIFTGMVEGVEIFEEPGSQSKEGEQEENGGQTSQARMDGRSM